MKHTILPGPPLSPDSGPPYTGSLRLAEKNKGDRKKERSVEVPFSVL